MLRAVPISSTAAAAAGAQQAHPCLCTSTAPHAVIRHEIAYKLSRRHATQKQTRSVVCSSSITPTEQLQDLLQPASDHASLSSTGSTSNMLSSSSISSISTSRQALEAAAGGMRTTRRQFAVVLPTAGSLLLPLLGSLLQPPPAAASKLGGLVDSIWEDMGGGPADLTFPESWLGVWDVTSTLMSVELPLGEDIVPNLAAVRRAQQQDLQKPLTYQVAFMRNPSGKVVYDRRFNTAALLATYYGSNVDFAGRITWDPKDPNSLNLSMPGDLSVRTRVMRRSEEQVAADRIETSEFMQQVFDSGDAGRPRVKASQCFTKYKYRDEAAAEAAGGPAIVATQVVSDYLTPFDSEQNYLAAANKPVTTYTYRMAFTRHHEAAHVASAVTLS